jgi:hypothetical protein
MTARLHYWYLTHPRWGRPALLAAVLQALSIAAVCAAPQASASTNASILNFTGLKDTYGVPIGDYYLSLASVRDQITQAGPGVTWNPQTWMDWTAHTVWTMLSGVTIANWLTAEAGLFVGLVALALWVMKITVSTYWVTVIGEIARAITAAVIHVTSQIGLLVLAVPIGVFAGVTTIRRGEAGRGWTMILVALTMPALSVAVFADPAGMMYGPDGLLAFGRRVGFSVAEAATHNGSAGGPDALTASLITHTVREPLQLWNFGHVVDHVGSCGAAWSGAVRAGASDGPVRAMAACGDRAALVYAQHLDGTNLWTGAVLVCAAVLLGVFMVVSGWAVLKVSVKAIWTTVILLPSLWVGSVPGAPQRRALDVVWQFFRHGIEVMVYIVFVSVIGLAVERIVSNPLPAELGGTNPFAHVLMMGAVSIVAFVLLRHVRADLSGLPRGHRGMIGRAADVAVGLGMHAAVGGAGSAALAGVNGLRGRFGNRGDTPWDRQDAAVENAAQVLGPPQPGVDPVPNTVGEPAGGGQDPDPGAAAPSPQGGSGGGAGDTAANPAPETGQLSGGISGVAPILDGLTRPRSANSREPQPAPRGSRPEPQPSAALLDPATGAALTGAAPAPASGAEQPAQVAPITDTGFSNREPLPPEPPPDDAPPPPDDAQTPPTPPTTVDPITDN